MLKIAEWGHEVVGHSGCGWFRGPIQPPTGRFEGSGSVLVWTVGQVVVDVPPTRGVKGEIDDDGPPVNDVVKVPASHQSRMSEHHLRPWKGTLEDGSGAEPVEVRIRHDAMNLRERALFHAGPRWPGGHQRAARAAKAIRTSWVDAAWRPHAAWCW